MTTRSSLVIIIFVMKGPKRDPTDTPSIWTYNFLLKEKVVLVQTSNNNFLSDLSPSAVEIFFLLYYSVEDAFNVFFNGTVVNKDLMSKDTKVYSSQYRQMVSNLSWKLP